MKRWLALFLCPLLLFLLQVPSEAAELSGIWKYREGNSPYDEIPDDAWSYSAMRDDPNWKEFPFPKQPLMENGDRYVWITTKLLPKKNGKNTLYFTPINQSFRVWLNDQVIYEYGQLKNKPLGYGRRWHMVLLPEFNIPAQLTLQLYSDSYREVGMFNNFELNTETEQIHLIFLSDLPRWLALPVALLMLMILAVYYFSPMAWKNLYIFGILFLLVMILWIISTSNVRQFWLDQPVFWWFCTKVTHYIMPLSINLVAYEVLEEHYRPTMQRILSVYVVFIGIALLEEIFGFAGMSRYIPIFYILMVCCQTAVCYWLLSSSLKGNSYSRALLVSVASLLVFQTVDGVEYMHLREMDVAITPFGVYAFFIFVMRLLYDQLEGKQELETATEGWANEVTEEHEKSEIDPLTSCYNRRKYEEILARESRKSEPTGKKLSLILMDIDHFKHFNDTYGHDAGDLVLKNFSDCLRKNLRGNRFLFRWGGEEFVILCPGDNLSTAVNLANYLRQIVESSKIFDRHQVTCSIGVSTWHHELGDNGEKLFQRADEALYRAKENGRNCVYQESWVF